MSEIIDYGTFINQDDEDKYNMLLESEATIRKLQHQLEEKEEEIQDLNRILGTWNNRELINKFNKEYDKEDKIKNPNRDYVIIYPDAEEVYKRYYEKESIIKEANNWVEMTIDTIKQQPSGNDEWLLERLNGIKKILDKENK